MNNLRFLLADDHLIVRQGIQMIIEDMYENSVFNHVSTLNQLKEEIMGNRYDVLILDVQFPDGNSLSLIPEIKKFQPELKILIFTSLEEENHSLRFLEAGADGFLAKLSEENEIKEAIRSIIETGEYHSDFTQKLLKVSKHSPHLLNPFKRLTERELEIADLYAKGYGNLEIANFLSIKQNTVSTYKKRIFEKLGIDNLVELIELIKNFRML